MMRKVIFFLLLILTTVHAWADNKATLTADAPDVVVSGDQFRLTFTVNTQKVKDFRAPSITKGFDVLMGPSRSQQSSTQIINGKVSSSSSITYTYILMAGNAGTYTIPAASIEANGEKYFPMPLRLKYFHLISQQEEARAVRGEVHRLTAVRLQTDVLQAMICLLQQLPVRRLYMNRKLYC